MNIKNILLAFVLISCFSLLNLTDVIGQSVSLTRSPNLKVDESIPQSAVDQMMTTLQTALNEYAEAAKLLDPNANLVNENSTARFNDLFSGGAKVVKDFAVFPPAELISNSDYALEVYNFLRGSGIQFTIEEAVLESIDADGLGFYTPVIFIRKRIFNTVSNDGEVSTSFNGKAIELKIKYDILSSDLERADIGEINYAKPPKAADDYTRFLSISLGLGSSILNSTNSSYLDANFAAGTLDVGGGLNFSFGAEFTTNQFITAASNSDRKLFVSAGIRFASYAVNTDLASFFLPDFEAEAVDALDGNSNRYIRKVGPVNAEEALRFNHLEIPIGIGYRLAKNQKSTILLHARLIPSLVLSGGGDITGEGVYDGILINELGVDGLPAGTISEFRILREGAVREGVLANTDAFEPYNVGIQNINEEADPTTVGLALALQLSPTLYLNFSDDNPGWGLMVGLDINYHLGSWVEHNPIGSSGENVLKFSDDYRESLLNLYLDDLSGLSFGLRLGLFQRLITKP